MIYKTLVFFILFATSFTNIIDAIKTEDQCTGEYEFWGCQSSTRQCQRYCQYKGEDRRKLRCKLDCEQACVCEAGYLRNGPDGECIYETECSNFNHETGKNDNNVTTAAGTVKEPAKKVDNKSGDFGAKLAQAKGQAQKLAGKSKPKRFAESYDHQDYGSSAQYIYDNPTQSDYDIAIGGVEYPKKTETEKIDIIRHDDSDDESDHESDDDDDD